MPAKTKMIKPKTSNNDAKKITKKTNLNISDVFIKNNTKEEKEDNNLSNSDKNTTGKTIEQIYQKKTQLEHILLRPDTYIGDVSIQESNLWVYDESKNKIVKKLIRYVPGLYKIFDEILVNSRDRRCIDPTCDTIKVYIDKEKNTISVLNNGTGIDVVEHSEHKMYVPEMLFGEFLTSTNYDDTQKRTTGGRNGYGAKLTNAYSKFFSIETVDGTRKLKFYQEFTNNMAQRTKPKITELNGEKVSTYTKITFQPDLARFKLKELTDDIIALMSKRVIDIAGVTNKVKIYLNDKKIDINNFKKYISMYELNENEVSEDENEDEINSESSETSKDNIIYEEVDRWRLGIMYVPDGCFEEISFVNGICTYNGGNHVDYVVNQIVKKLEGIILKKYKEAKIKANTIKDNLIIFLDTIIDNPSFTSQTKETLKNKPSEFGSSYEPSEKLIKKLASTGIVDQIISMAKMKEESFLKKTDGKKTASVKGISKLEDANWAGDKKKSVLCSLILTEGDSAKALAMAGRSVVGSDRFGVFPLKGKLLNVRDASPAQLLNNEEITNIKKILGLQHNKVYNNLNELRYGRIICMCDQDYDGYHIKGLIMNFIHYFWPSLIKHSNFITALATPIVKATRSVNNKKDVKVFYNVPEFEKWKVLPEASRYSIKYYKGLGTSTKEEAIEYFKDIENKLISYTNSVGNYNDPNEINNIENDIIVEDLDNVNNLNNLEILEENEDENNDNEEKIEVKKTKTKKTEQNTEQKEDDEYSEIYRKSINKKKIFGVQTKYYDDTTEAITLAFEKLRANCRKTWLRNFNKNRVLLNSQKNVPIPDFIHKELIHFSNDDINRSIPSVMDGLKPSTRKIVYGAIKRKLYLSKDEIKVAQLAGYISEHTCYHHGEASLHGAIVGLAQNFIGSNNINLLFPSGQYGTRLVGGKDSASPRYIFTYLAELTRTIIRPEDDPILNYLDDDGVQVEPEYFYPIIPMVLVNGAEGIGTGFSTFVGKFNPLDLVDNIKLMIQKKPQKELKPYYRNFTGTIETVKKNEYIIKGKYARINNDTIRITELPIGTWITPYREFLEKKTEKVGTANPMIENLKCNYTDETIDFTLMIDPELIDKYENNEQMYDKLKLSKSLKMNNMHLYTADGSIKKYDSPNDILVDFYNTRLQMYTKRKEYLIGKLSKELDILKWKKMFIEYVLDNKIIIYKQKKATIIDRLIELKFPKLSTSSEDNNASYDYITDIPLFNLTQEKIDELNEKFNAKEEELRHVQTVSEIEQWTYELDEFVEKYKEWIELHSNLDKKEKNDTKLVKKVIVKKVIKKVTKE